MAGLHFDETASDEGGVETTNHGTVLVEYHLEQGVLVVVGVGATTDDVMVCLILMHVAEFGTTHPEDGVEPAETCQHLDEPQFEVVVVGDVRFLVAQDDVLAFGV